MRRPPGRKELVLLEPTVSAHFGSARAKVRMIQKRLARPLCQDDTQIREALHVNPTNTRINGENSAQGTQEWERSLSLWQRHQGLDGL